MENSKSEAAMLAIIKLIVVFDFREAKMSRGIPCERSSQKDTVYSSVAYHDSRPINR